MAGKKQHYIPQVLLRNFKINKSGKLAKVWVIRKDKKPFISPTSDAAAQRHFYSKISENNEETLDDKITSYENKILTRLLSSLIKTPVGSEADSLESAEVITHLTLRNAHFRGTFSNAIYELISGISEAFTSPETARLLLGLGGDTPNRRFQDNFQIFLRDNDWLTKIGLPIQVLEQVGFILYNESFGENWENQHSLIKLLFEQIKTKADDFIKDGHNIALSKGLVPDSRMEKLSTFTWHMTEPPRTPIILPDCVALAERNGEIYPLMTVDYRDLETILLPLSPQRVLIGTRGDAVLPDLRDFNLLAAACSHELFISSVNSEECTSLQQLIGRDSWTILKESVLKVIKDNNFMQKIGLPDRIEEIDESIASETHSSEYDDNIVTPWDNQPLPNGFSYQVSFHCDIDREVAEQIAQTVNNVVLEVSRLMPLSRIDGFTFTADYATTLAELDRGFEASRPLEPIGLEYGTSVAMAPLVRRDGEIKSRIVMRSELGYSLISEDQAFFNIAIHTLVYMLAHVASIEFMERSIPGSLLTRIEDEYEARIYSYVDPVWGAYFAARVSARFDDGAGDAYNDLLIGALIETKKSILEARFAYRYHGNIDELLHIALSSVGRILQFSSRVLGHYDGLQQPPYTQSDRLKIEMEKVGLANWFSVFQGELQTLWKRRGNWPALDDFLNLNRHAERVLWQFALFLWRTPEGQCRLEVPLISDAHRLMGMPNANSLPDNLEST